MSIRESLQKLIGKMGLAEEEMESCVDEIMSGTASGAQIAAFITLLKVKGETAEELTGAARSLRKHMIKVKLGYDVILDTCGTGGDQSGSFNVSTLSAVILAAGGVKVAKHGNRAASSKCGSADLLELLGAKIDLPAERVKASIDKTNLGFLFAPSFHPALKNVVSVRKELPFRTIFNCIGPLANPACSNYQVLGVPNRQLLPVMAKALSSLGSKAAMVFNNSSGLDELFLSDNYVYSLSNGSASEYMLKPEDVGLKKASIDEIRCKDPSENKEVALSLFKGKSGPCLDTLLLNSAAGFVITGRCKGFIEGISYSRSVIESGQAYRKLNEFIEFTNA